LGGADFVSRMNLAAAVLGMGETKYLNPSGLDELDGRTNLSSASDLSVLLEDIIKHEPELLAVSQQIAVPIKRADGSFHHLATNTNELLPLARWPAEIVGGKTGQTDLARKNLALVLRDSASGGYVINIVLGSENHFSDMTRLTDWVYQNYQFL
jgi:D-alanyl-D-alanine carboxypeptidase